MRRVLLGLVCALATASCMPVMEGQDYNLEGQEVRLTPDRTMLSLAAAAIPG